MDDMCRCEHDECSQHGKTRTYPDGNAICLCDEHAIDFGFCLLCDTFVGGTEDVFLTEMRGVCWECYAEAMIEAEADDD